ncbi:MAG: urease accessory protein UreE, partial [Dinoroseobacter sp.]
MNRPIAQTVVHAHQTDDSVTLTYEARFLRRKVLTSDGGTEFLVDLDKTTSLNAGDALVFEDGRKIAVLPASEALLEISGASLVRLAWHIGNRHMPCQIEDTRLLIKRDHVIRDMLEK